MLVHAIEIVPLAVFDSLDVERILWHAHFWTVEYGRLVHVVPCIAAYKKTKFQSVRHTRIDTSEATEHRSSVGDLQIHGAANVSVKRELLRPPLTHVRLSEVEVA